MTDNEFESLYNEHDKKERILDGNCTTVVRSGLFPKHLMKKMRLLHTAGIHGKTRIVIEYDNDAGEGWVRIVTEDTETISCSCYKDP